MHMEPHSQHKFGQWQEENKILQELKAVRPELFATEKRSSVPILQEIGIAKSSEGLPMGYIKYLPFDFIVEEIRKDGSVVTIERAEEQNTVQSEGATVFADLVKVGISSIEAVELIAKSLACDPRQLSYAGIKDTVAITAQKMSIRNIPSSTVASLTIPQLFLKNITVGKGVIMVGDLEGNRFTLYIRTSNDFDPSALDAQVAAIKADGLYNYYGPQRFGTPRYISHILGKYILQGNFEMAVRSIISKTSKFEWLFVTQLRQKAEQLGTDWKKIHALFSTVPYTFRSELQLLERLLQWNGTGDQWIYALGFAPDQIDLWCKAYASYLANKLLYKAEHGDIELPEQIPLLLNTAEAEKIEALYGAYLREDGTTNFRSALAKFRFIRVGSNSYISTKIFPTIHHIKKMPHGVALSFDLVKGAYATTLLYELFDIVEGEEYVEKINTDYVDTKKELGIGSFEDIYDWASQYVDPENR